MKYYDRLFELVGIPNKFMLDTRVVINGLTVSHIETSFFEGTRCPEIGDSFSTDYCTIYHCDVVRMKQNT